MKYQLVLQFPASTIEDFDWLIETEGALESALRGRAIVDGHDMGSGEMNLFIHTNEPEATFKAAQALLGEGERVENMAAAHRELEGEEYTILWPPGRTEFKIV